MPDRPLTVNKQAFSDISGYLLTFFSLLSQIVARLSWIIEIWNDTVHKYNGYNMAASPWRNFRRHFATSQVAYSSLGVNPESLALQEPVEEGIYGRERKNYVYPCSMLILH